jgi:hypothetical protein
LRLLGSHISRLMSGVTASDASVALVIDVCGVGVEEAIALLEVRASWGRDACVRYVCAPLQRAGGNAEAAINAHVTGSSFASSSEFAEDP